MNHFGSTQLINLIHLNKWGQLDFQVAAQNDYEINSEIEY